MNGTKPNLHINKIEHVLHGMFMFQKVGQMCAVHQSDRTKEREKQKARQKYKVRTFWDKLINSGLVSLSHVNDSTDVFRLADCRVWSPLMRHVAKARIHTVALIFLNG